MSNVWDDVEHDDYDKLADDEVEEEKDPDPSLIFLPHEQDDNVAP